MKNLFAIFSVIVVATAFSSEAVYSPAKAELKQVKGVPCVFVNGEMLPPMSFTGWWMHRMEDDYLASLGRAGLRIHYIYSWTRWLKPGDPEKGELDGVEETVKRIRHVKKNCPDAYVVIRLMVSPTKDWIDEHPEEQILFTDGSRANTICTTVDRRRRVNMYSLCSEKWWARADEAIEDFYRELQKYPEFSSVIGTFLCSAGTCEWYYPCIFRNGKTKATGDCSQPFLKQYRRYLKEMYAKDVEPKIPSFSELDYIGDEAEKIKAALRGGKPYVRGENPAAFGDFLNADRAAHVADFFQALHDGTARAIVHFAETLKRVQPSLLVGAFYGSFSQTIPHDGGTAAGLKRILDSEAVDFLAAPPGYNCREPGGLCIGRTAQDAFLLRGKIFISEDDDRTFLTWRPPSFLIKDDPVKGSGLVGTLNMLKRDFGRNICEGTRGWWFDMARNRPGESWFYKDENILSLFAEQQKIAHQAYMLGAGKHNDIALIFDSLAIHFSSFWLVSNVLDNWRLCDLNRLGAPVDYHLRDDLSDPRMRDYRLYVMLNCYVLSDAEREAIYAKARKNNASILWMYAPGFINREAAKAMSEAHIEKTVGMKVSLYADTIRADYRPEGSRSVYQFFDTDIHSCEFGSRTESKVENYINPGFFIDDPSAKPLARYVADGKVMLASKMVKGVKVYYCTNQVLNRHVLGAIADEAGCHRYNRVGDVLYANDRYLTIHATGAGRRVLHFKSKCSPYDVYAKKTLSRDVDSLAVDLEHGETRMLRLD